MRKCNWNFLEELNLIQEEIRSKGCEYLSKIESGSVIEVQLANFRFSKTPNNIGLQGYKWLKDKASHVYIDRKQIK